MSTFRFTRRARSDLDQIAAYSLETWDEARTELYIAAPLERTQWLAENPKLGRSRGEVADNYRSFRQGSHIIFYVVIADQIAIIGSPRGSMDIDAYFEQRQESSE